MKSVLALVVGVRCDNGSGFSITGGGGDGVNIFCHGVGGCFYYSGSIFIMVWVSIQVWVVLRLSLVFLWRLISALSAVIHEILFSCKFHIRKSGNKYLISALYFTNMPLYISYIYLVKYMSFTSLMTLSI